jgi:sugar/nucleoside kinase (ribokinase family)
MPEAREAGMLALDDLLALNEDEATALVGFPFPVDGEARELRLSAERLIVTAGARGAFAFDGADWTFVPPLTVTVASTAGAGDALVGGVLAGLAAGLPFVKPGPPRARLVDRPLVSAFELGLLVASFKVTSPHTIPPGFSAAALTAFAREHGVALGERLSLLLCRESSKEHTHGD